MKPRPAVTYKTHDLVYDLITALSLWGPENMPEEIRWTEVPGVSLKHGLFVTPVKGT